LRKGAYPFCLWSGSRRLAFIEKFGGSGNCLQNDKRILLLRAPRVGDQNNAEVNGLIFKKIKNVSLRGEVCPEFLKCCINYRFLVYPMIEKVIILKDFSFSGDITGKISANYRRLSRKACMKRY
jgi:hypothetical protein